MFDLVITSMAAAIAIFSLSLLLKQNTSSAIVPFSTIMICLTILSLGPAVFALLPSFEQLYIALLPTIFFVFLPSVWLYQQTLMSSDPWHWNKSTIKHLVSVPFAMGLSLLLCTMPSESFQQMLYAEEMVSQPVAYAASLFFFFMFIVWCLLSFCYTLAMIKRTISYRRELKTVFSDQQGKTMGWLNLFSYLVLLSWIYALTVLLFEERLQAFGIFQSGVFILLLLLVWLIAANGLSQRPGFEDIIDTDLSAHQPNTIQVSKLKKESYQRSALNLDDLSQIAAKLRHAITADQVHLCSDINLLRLSKQIGVPSQYISQTLSQHLGTNFFDFINKARIDDAKRLLTGTERSVLDVAVSSGFNARSSFYKAFKQFADVTPIEYRRLHGCSSD